LFEHVLFAKSASTLAGHALERFPIGMNREALWTRSLVAFSSENRDSLSRKMLCMARRMLRGDAGESPPVSHKLSFICKEIESIAKGVRRQECGETERSIAAGHFRFWLPG
jgi:hypothetical protein